MLVTRCFLSVATGNRCNRCNSSFWRVTMRSKVGDRPMGQRQGKQRRLERRREANGSKQDVVFNTRRGFHTRFSRVFLFLHPKVCRVLPCVLAPPAFFSKVCFTKHTFLCSDPTWLCQSVIRKLGRVRVPGWKKGFSWFHHKYFIIFHQFLVWDTVSVWVLDPLILASKHKGTLLACWYRN